MFCCFSFSVGGRSCAIFDSGFAIRQSSSQSRESSSRLQLSRPQETFSRAPPCAVRVVHEFSKHEIEHIVSDLREMVDFRPTPPVTRAHSKAAIKLSPLPERNVAKLAAARQRAPEVGGYVSVTGASSPAAPRDTRVAGAQGTRASPHIAALKPLVDIRTMHEALPPAS